MDKVFIKDEQSSQEIIQKSWEVGGKNWQDGQVLFDKEALSSQGKDKNTIEFIESNLLETKHKTQQLDILKQTVQLQPDDYFKMSSHKNKIMTLSQEDPQHDTVNSKQKQKPMQVWNTGTKDFSKLNQTSHTHLEALISSDGYHTSIPSTKKHDDDLAEFRTQITQSQISASQIQTKKNQLIDQYKSFKRSKNIEIGEMARYQQDSDKSYDELDDQIYIDKSTRQFKHQSNLERQNQMSQNKKVPASVVYNKDGSLPAGRLVDIVNSCLKDPEIALREQKVRAMREKDQQELDHHESILLQANDDPDQRIQQKPKLSKSDQLKAMIAREQNQNESKKLAESVKKTTIEKDPIKWEGTGLEDIVRTIETTSIKQVDDSNQYIDPVEKKKNKKKNKKDQKKKKKLNQEIATEAQLKFVSDQNQSLNQDKQQIQTSLFQKSSPIQLPQQQREKPVLYDLNRPFYINEKFDYIQGQQLFVPSTGTYPERAIKSDQRPSHFKTNLPSTHHNSFRESTKGQITTASKFYTLNECQSLPCHFTQNKDLVQTLKASQSINLAKDGPKVFGNGPASEICELTLHSNNQIVNKRLFQNNNQSQILARSNQYKPINRQGLNSNYQNEQSIPSIIDWFGQLSLSERVLSMTTVDSTITGSIIQMFKQLRANTPNDYHSKFRLASCPTTFSVQVTENNAKKNKNSVSEKQQKCGWTMLMSNRSAHKSKEEVKQAEAEFLKYVRITDSQDMHDTLTIKEELVRQPEYFYQLAKQIVGSNFLIGRHQIVWLQDIQAFLSKQPLWIEMQEPNSLAAWILYYLERALCIQYTFNIYGTFEDIQIMTPQIRDQIFLHHDRLLICNEMRPSWRNLCDEVASDQHSEQLSNFLKLLKQNCYQKFGIVSHNNKTQKTNSESSKVNQFNGGLAIQSQKETGSSIEQKCQVSHFDILVDEFILRIKNSILAWQSESISECFSQLDMSELCMDQPMHVSAITNQAKEQLSELASKYNGLCGRLPSQYISSTLGYNINSSQAQFETVHTSEQRITRMMIEMRLERIMAQTLKDFRNQRLLQGHNSQNKKILKKKLKKKLQKEKEQEKLRQQIEEQTKLDTQKNKGQEQIESRSSSQLTSQQQDLIKVNNSKAVQLLLGTYQDNQQQTSTDKSPEPALQFDMTEKPHLEKDIEILQTTIRKSTDIDPFNYFQNLDRHQTNIQISGQPATSNCTVTTKTKSTCDRSNQKSQLQNFQGVMQINQSQINSAMSNQDIITLQQVHQIENDADNYGYLRSKQNLKEGNANLKNRDWQRKSCSRGNNAINEIIGELLSESSSKQYSSGGYKQKQMVIDLTVQNNMLHVHKAHVSIDNEQSDECPSKSSQSSKKANNQMILFNKKHHRRVKPHERKKPSSSSEDEGSDNSSSSDQDLLPDLFNQFDPQPGDNDSSDFGAEEHHLTQGDDQVTKSLCDGSNSSIILEKSINEPSSILAGSAHQRTQNFSDKKSIHTANPKIEGGLHLVISEQDKRQSNRDFKNYEINFFKNQTRPSEQSDQFDLHDFQATQIENRQSVSNKKQTVNKGVKLPRLEAMTCQYIVLQQQQETCKELLRQDGKPNKKKTKKQRQQEYLNLMQQKNNHQSDEPAFKQIEIIKPEPIIIQNKKKKKNNEQNRLKEANTNQEKKKKKKQQNQEQVLNSFIIKMQTANSDDLTVDINQKNAKSQFLQKPKIDQSINQSSKQHVDTILAQNLLENALNNVIQSSDDQDGATRSRSKRLTKENFDESSNLDTQREQILSSSASNSKYTNFESNQQPYEKKKSVTQQQQQTQQSGPINQNSSQIKCKSNFKESNISDQTGTSNANSHEFKFQKKQLVQSNKLEPNSQLKSSAKKQPTFQFSSLQEALEYNQVIKENNQIESKKEQNQTNSNQLKQASSISDKEKNSKIKQTSNQDLASEKSQQSSQRKKKKQRAKKKEQKNSEQSSLNLQLQESYIDPATGQTVYMGMSPIHQSNSIQPTTQSIFGAQVPLGFGLDSQTVSQDTFNAKNQIQQFQQLQQQIMSMQSQQQAAGQNNKFNTYQPIGSQTVANSLLGQRAMPNLQQQVEELVLQIRDQYMAQQQIEIAEQQMRQKEQEEMQMRDDCEPCQEENEERFLRYFEELGQEMLNKVKDIDRLKDSVRREREGFIKIIESIVKDTFQQKHGNGYVGIKMFGSMVTDLAIETSDVDLVVTGINTNRQIDKSEIITPKEQVLKVMQKLHDNLVLLKTSGQIQTIKFIREATVPIIKLVADLQIIHELQIEKAKLNAKKEWEYNQANQNTQKVNNNDKESAYTSWDQNLKELGIQSVKLDDRMRFLQVDISIDEHSDGQIDGTRKNPISQIQTASEQANQALIQNPFSSKSAIYNQNASIQTMINSSQRGHNGIDTIYHIQELQKARKHLRPIVMIIKKIFDQTFLSTPFYGGLSSYSLVLMVSAYLKRFDENNTESLSRNLSGFFHFYGCYFKPQEFYLDGDNIKLEEIKRPFRDPFIVLDPLDRSNNIGRGSFRIKDVQRAFVQAFKIINKSCEQYQRIENPYLVLESDHGYSQCIPAKVLNRLLTEIKAQYQQSCPNFFQADMI